jgi:late competence protein required for DNA uptake (superfamily II DNA/RNA helicase)
MSCGYFPVVISIIPCLLQIRATGVTTSVVEDMEKSFKKDVVRELREGNGRILLHDEVEERPGTFSIIPIWEVVEEHEIMTPQNVIDLVIKLGYRVSWGLCLRKFIQYSLICFARSIMAE